QADIPMDGRTHGAVVYENMETQVPGIFACGNVLHVHDLVDYVTAESQRAGTAAARYVQGKATANEAIPLTHGSGVSYTIPQRIRRGSGKVQVLFRVGRVFGDSRIVVKDDAGNPIAQFPRSHMAPG